ncbi:hypothetical protein KM043_010834 [Ampulex compressa]|nr:hypothetical protein KM043_010834 [Ampulex compressa]
MPRATFVFLRSGHNLHHERDSLLQGGASKKSLFFSWTGQRANGGSYGIPGGREIVEDGEPSVEISQRHRRLTSDNIRHQLNGSPSSYARTMLPEPGYLVIQPAEGSNGVGNRAMLHQGTPELSGPFSRPRRTSSFLLS